MRTLEDPLEPQDIETLRESVELANRIEKAINRAQRVGLDFGSNLPETRRQRELAENMLREYGPGT